MFEVVLGITMDHSAADIDQCQIKIGLNRQCRVDLLFSTGAEYVRPVQLSDHPFWQIVAGDKKPFHLVSDWNRQFQSESGYGMNRIEDLKGGSEQLERSVCVYRYEMIAICGLLVAAVKYGHQLQYHAVEYFNGSV